MSDDTGPETDAEYLALRAQVAATLAHCRDALRRARAALILAMSAFPDSETAGPAGTGYAYAWDELTGDEQEWVKEVRQQIAALAPPPTDDPLT